ncbi:LOW QUALITY PROTEIN: gem-associated protein 7 [Mergus octosetaceus]
MAVPVSVLRLPRGPEGSSRGFSPSSPRFQALTGTGALGGSQKTSSPPQAARAALRLRYLRSLGAMRGLPVSFTLHERGRVGAVVAAADAVPLTFQVDALRTPLGLQAAALLRCSDIIAYAFELPLPAPPERENLPQNERSENSSGDHPERGIAPQNGSENGGREARKKRICPKVRVKGAAGPPWNKGILPKIRVKMAGELLQRKRILPKISSSFPGLKMAAEPRQNKRILPKIRGVKTAGDLS